MEDKKDLLKLVYDFYNCDRYEGSNLDNDLKVQLTKYIYGWYQNNLDKLIGNNKRKYPVRWALSKFIANKVWKGSHEEIFRIISELNLDLIIEGRLMQDIDYNEDIFELSPKKGLTLNVKYKTISNSFKALSTYMIENDMDKDFISGLMKFIPEKTNEASSSKIVSDNEKIIDKKMFFFNSSLLNEIESCVFYEAGYDIISPEASAMALQNYIISHNYKNKAEIESDNNIQFQSDDMLDTIIQKYNISFDKKNVARDYSVNVEKTKTKK